MVFGLREAWKDLGWKRVGIFTMWPEDIVTNAQLSPERRLSAAELLGWLCSFEKRSRQDTGGPNAGCWKEK